MMKKTFDLKAITCRSVRYYTNDKAKCSDDVCFIGKDKYPKKILTCIAISKWGMSKPYFRLSTSVPVNTDIYIDEFLQSKLLPFIHKHHSDVNYLFWPDLAGAHYSNETVAWMEEHLVEKVSNSPKNLCSVFWHSSL